VARATSEAGDVPGIEFVTEAERFPVCNGALKVYKSRSRQVITLASGSFRAIETLKQCGEDSTHPLMGSNGLARQVVPRQRYGYDLIVHVGCARLSRMPLTRPSSANTSPTPPRGHGDTNRQSRAPARSRQEWAYELTCDGYDGQRVG
jgi:hypothetical protein